MTLKLVPIDFNINNFPREKKVGNEGRERDEILVFFFSFLFSLDRIDKKNSKTNCKLPQQNIYF